jgi:hypothetical protein
MDVRVMYNKISVHEDCPIELVRAINRFGAKVTSHTTTSKKYSIWTLCKDEIESAIVKALGKNLYGVIFIKGFADDAKNISDIEDRLRMYARLFSDYSSIDNLMRKRFGILESLLYLLYFCKSCRSKKYIARHDVRILERRIHRGNTQDYPFCELCWKLCEFEQIRFDSNNDTENLNGSKNGCKPSFRFCTNHRPGTSAYRRDHNRRKEFLDYVNKLGRSLGNGTVITGKETLLDLMDGGIDESINANKYVPLLYSEYYANIRYIAYYNVHPDSKLTRRKTNSIGRSGVTLNKVRIALAKGKNISEAAEEAKVSRQAAWYALKTAGDL